MMLYLQLFWTFFKIGLFGFGGGYAMLSLIQGEVVTHHSWLTMQEFTDIVAVSQCTPGPIGINSATYVGYTATGSVLGSIIATIAVVLPSFILMLTVSKLVIRYRHHFILDSVFKGLRPAVIGLFAAATLLLMTRENFSSPDEDLYSFICSCCLFLATFLLLFFRKLSAIHLILLSAAAGLILY